MEKDLGNYKSVRLMAAPRKITDQSFPARMAKCMKNKTVKQHAGIYQRQIVPEQLDYLLHWDDWFGR